MRCLALILALAAPAWSAGGQRSRSTTPAPSVVVVPQLGQSSLPNLTTLPSLQTVPGLSITQAAPGISAPAVASLSPSALALEASSTQPIPQARALELKARLTSLVADPVALAALGPIQAQEIQAALATITFKTAARREERVNTRMLDMVAGLGKSRKAEALPEGFAGADGERSRSSMLSAADGIRTGGSDDREPPAPRGPASKPHPLAKAGFLASALGILIGLPALAGATIGGAATLSMPAIPDLPTLLFGLIAAAGLAAARIALAFVTVRMSPSNMRGKNPDLESRPLLSLVPALALAAWAEEFTFRAVATPIATLILLSQGWGPALALAAATFAVSVLFSIVHGYGQFWSRVVGGSYYTAVYVFSGSLMFTTAVHFFFNLGLILLLKTAAGKRLENWSERRPPAA